MGQAIINGVFISKYQRTLNNGAGYQWFDGDLFHIVQHADDHLTTPLDHAENRWLFLCKSSPATSTSQAVTPCRPGFFLLHQADLCGPLPRKPHRTLLRHSTERVVFWTLLPRGVAVPFSEHPPHSSPIPMQFVGLTGSAITDRDRVSRFLRVDGGQKIPTSSGHQTGGCNFCTDNAACSVLFHHNPDGLPHHCHNGGNKCHQARPAQRQPDSARCNSSAKRCDHERDRHTVPFSATLLHRMISQRKLKKYEHLLHQP